MLPDPHLRERRHSCPSAASPTALSEDVSPETKQWDIKNSNDFAQWYNSAGPDLLAASYEKYQYVKKWYLCNSIVTANLPKGRALMSSN